MGNVIENNPFVAAVGYTLLIASAAVSATIFVLRDNRETLATAQLETQKATTEQYRVKLDLEDKTIAELQQQLEEYKAWAASDENAVPAIIPRITDMKKKIGDLEKANADLREASKTASSNQTPKLGAREELSASKGTAYINPSINLVVAVLGTSPDQTATLRLTLPGQKPIQADSVPPGQQWSFDLEGKHYLLTVEQVIFLVDSVNLILTEVH